MSTLEDRVLAIEQHLGLNVVQGVFAEPTNLWSVVLLDCLVCEKEHTIIKVQSGWRYRNAVQPWKFWVHDAKEGSLRLL